VKVPVRAAGRVSEFAEWENEKSERKARLGSDSEKKS
jgi:hypothetical protein